MISDKTTSTEPADITQTPLLKDKNLHVIFGVTLTAVMGVSSIAPALPNIARALDVTSDRIGLLITVFTIPGMFLTPVLGMMADRLGRKRILIPSLFLFGIAGAACSLAADFTQLLILRFLQGVGGAALGTLNITLVGDLYEGNRRATAMGYNGSILSIGTASYPIIGGLLATIAWFYPFYLFLAAVPVGIFAIFTLDNPEPANGADIRVYVRKILASIRSKKVIGLFLANLLTFIILFGGFLTYFPILLDESFGQSAFVIGAMLSGSSLVTVFTSAQLGNLTRRFAEHRLILTASILYAIILAIIPLAGKLWHFILPIMLFGFAQGINIPSILNLLAGHAPSEYRAAFLSLNWTVIRTGQAMGPYVLGLIYALLGINGTFYVTAVVAVLLIFVVVFMIRPGRET